MWCFASLSFLNHEGTKTRRIREGGSLRSQNAFHAKAQRNKERNLRTKEREKENKSNTILTWL
jgi:hypothetical protein